VFTVLLSIFLHGITAVPLSRLYAGNAAGSAKQGFDYMIKSAIG